MTLKHTMLLFTVWGVMLVSGCSGDKGNNSLNSTSLRGSGIMETQSRNISDFDEIVLSAAGEVNVTFGYLRSVSVTVDNNIMPYLETAQTGNRLDIKIKQGINAVDYDLEVKVVVPELKAIELRGAGSILGHNLLQTSSIDLALTGTGSIDLEIDASDVNTVFSGPGTVTLTGTTDFHTCFMSSPGTLRAYGLATGITHLTSTGPGSAEINVSDTLKAKLTGPGSVYYTGYPRVIVHRTGIGDVIDSN